MGERFRLRVVSHRPTVPGASHQSGPSTGIHGGKNPLSMDLRWPPPSWYLTLVLTYTCDQSLCLTDRETVFEFGDSCPQGDSGYHRAGTQWREPEWCVHSVHVSKVTEFSRYIYRVKMKRSSSLASGHERTAFQQLVSCQLCRTRKLKCDRGRPCFNCSSRNFDCVYISGEK